MMILELLRLEETRQGTIGVLKINKEVFCYTLEPSDRLNQRNRSSIPAQQYVCHQYRSARHGETWEVTDVPGRDYILFHAGNIVAHTEGCILLGNNVGKLRGERAVLNSGNTFALFMEVTRQKQVLHLTINEHY